MTDKPHNNFFQFIFSQKSIVEDLIVNLLEDLHTKIDLSTLTYDNITYVGSNK